MFFCKISASLIARLVAAPVGKRISEVWTGFWVNGDTGRFPVKMRFRAPANVPFPDQVYNLGIYWRKAAESEIDGRRYSIDHWELRFYPKTSEELVAAGIETVYVLDFALCGKREDIAFSRQPFKIWRVEGTTERGVLYGYDPAYQPEVRISGINSEIIRTMPVRVTAVGVEPITAGPKNSTSFIKYEVEGAESLYDRRHKKNGSGLLEVVRTIKGDRSWLYFNLKDLNGVELPADAAVLIASNGKLAIVDQEGEPALKCAEAGEYM